MADETTTSEATTTTEKPSPPPLPKDPNMYLPIYIGTGIFAAIFIIGPLLFRKGPNSGIIRCSIMIAVFSMWLFWVTVYIAQMNPLVGPRVKNRTLAWIAHKWGEDTSPPPPTTASTEQMPTDGGASSPENF